MWSDSENMFAGKEKFGEQNRGKEKIDLIFLFQKKKKSYLTCIIPAGNLKKRNKEYREKYSYVTKSSTSGRTFKKNWKKKKRKEKHAWNNITVKKKTEAWTRTSYIEKRNKKTTKKHDFDLCVVLT